MAKDSDTASGRMRWPSVLLFPSTANIVFVSTVSVLIFSLGNALLSDGDTGYHIRTGELIAQTWRIPYDDPYSYHYPPLKWTAHEWLSELVMATIVRGFGLTGVVVFFAFILATAQWLLYRVLRSKSDNTLLCIFVTLLASATSSTHWLARPHAFSLLFTVVWCHCLDRFQSGNERALNLLPVLMLLWVNLHGGYFIGLLLVVIYLTGNFFYSLTEAPDVSQKSVRNVKGLSLLLFVCVCVCMVNPYGPKILWFPIHITSDRFVMDRVTEFLSPNFHDALPFKYMLLALIGALALSRSALNLIDCSLIVLLSYMSLYSVRHVSLFAIILAPVLLKTASGIFDRMPKPILEFYRMRNRNLNAIDGEVNGYVWPVSIAALIMALAASGSIMYQFDEKVFPVAAVEFLKREPITGNMFNNDEFGDYIIFTAWPAYRVYIDGRSDMYGEKYGGDYLKIADVQPGWKEILKKYGVSWVIFNTQSPLTAALHDQIDWQAIYSDSVATIFVKNAPEHALLLAKYPAVNLVIKQ
jgi:hypothetical protein